MSQITFPQFSNMQPVAEDLQLIVDSLRTETKNRLTADGIFNPGIVGEQIDYLSQGTSTNTIKIKPFIAYTQNGNRIEVESILDNLSPQGTVIPVSQSNIIQEHLNIPYWQTYLFDYFNNLRSETTSTASLKLAELGRGSILQGIKLKVNTIFSAEGSPEITVSIGTASEPDKFLPETIISDNADSTNISVMNLMYSLNDTNKTDIYLTFKGNTVTLNQLTSGVLKVSLCITNLSDFDNSDLDIVNGGYNLSSSSTPAWEPSRLYHIVARYIEDEGDFRNLQYTDAQGNVITTNPEAARLTTNYQLLALRKNGQNIDYTTLDDVKLGEVQINSDGKIYSININGTNSSNEAYTQYLTIPGYRLVKNIDATQIGDGSVNNTQFEYLNTLTSNVQSQLNTKATITGDNTFTGKNTFTQQIDGDIKTVNSYSAYSTPTPNSLLVLDENGKIPADAISENALVGIGNVYTVSTGPTTNGRSSYLSVDTENNIIVNASEDNPLTLNYPDGSTEKITSDVELGGLTADGYYYLIKEKNGNFSFLPTAGGTTSAIPLVDTANKFVFNSNDGTVKSTYSSETTYNAFDGTITTGTQVGKVYYRYNNYSEIFTGTPALAYIEINFPEAIKPTAFATCFRIENQLVCTPKNWEFQATNEEDGPNKWDNPQPLASASNDSWDENEIKTIIISNQTTAYKSFRFVFEVTKTGVINYVEGQSTTYEGINIPINCYYFQMYINNENASNNISEGYVLPQNPSVGNYFLDISKKPYIGYKATGMVGADAWIKTNYVKLGFINLVGYGTDNVQITTYPFCYNTFTISDDNTFPGQGNTNILSQNTPITFNHNLGIVPNVVDIKFQCLEDDTNGYNAGDIVSEIWTKDTQGLRSVKSIISADVLNLTMYPCFTSDSFYIIDNDSSSSTYRQLTTTNGSKWKVIIYCSRGW